MRVACVDTSWAVAIAFGEAGHAALIADLEQHDRLYSAALLEAELWSACKREGVSPVADLLAQLSWLLPDRPPSAELSRVFDAGYLRGADAWHVACALFLADRPSSITFLTLDSAQREVARSLGFVVEPHG